MKLWHITDRLTGQHVGSYYALTPMHALDRAAYAGGWTDFEHYCRHLGTLPEVERGFYLVIPHDRHQQGQED